MITAAELQHAALPRYRCGHPRVPDNTDFGNGHGYCRVCNRQRARDVREHRLTAVPQIRHGGTRIAFAKLRDGLPLSVAQLKSLRGKGLAFYDETLKRYRCEPLALQAFNECEGAL